MSEDDGLRLIRGPECDAETPAGHWGMKARRLFDSGPLRVQYCEMDADGGAEAHVHDAQDQILVVVRGALRVGGGEEEVTAREGDAVYVPAGAPHATEPPFDAATYLTLTFPTADG